MGKLTDELYDKYCAECKKYTSHIGITTECSECNNIDCIFVCKECINNIKKKKSKKIDEQV